jgi:hypothetical protein
MKQELIAVEPPRTLRERIGELLFTADRLQQRCLSALALSALVYVVCIGILMYGSAQGLFAPGPVRIPVR